MNLHKKLTSNRLLIFLLFISLIFSVNTTFAMTVVQIKNEKALLDLQGDQVEAKQVLSLVSKNNPKQKLAQVKVIQVKNGKAVVQILSGSLTAKTEVAISGQKLKSASSSAKKNSGKSFHAAGAPELSFLLKYEMNAISVKLTDGSTPVNTETVNLKGNSVGLGAAYDFMYADPLIVRLIAAYEPLNVKGTGQFNSCNGKTSKDCFFKVNYLSFGGLARYNVTQGSIPFWLGGGFVLKVPTGKSSTAIDTSSIKFAKDLVFAFGTDYHFSQTSFIPINVEYHYSLDKTTSVPIINQLALNFGYGFTF